jgi:hypothetical protein
MCVGLSGTPKAPAAKRERTLMFPLSVIRDFETGCGLVQGRLWLICVSDYAAYI